ncbi:hypothetical protein FRB90_004349 [Tulasnella sp. 427]|nr:hypothetical protein FRB90_004349 [Tulasnella sp. 427]
MLDHATCALRNADSIAVFASRSTFAENLVLSRLRSSEATDIYLAFWTGRSGDEGDEANAAAQLLQETRSILYPKPAKKFEQERAAASMNSAEIGDNALVDLQVMGLTSGLYRRPQ